MVITFEHVSTDHDTQVGRYHAYYAGGYAAISYRYHQRAFVVFMTGMNVPNEADLLTQFLDWVWGR